MTNAEIAKIFENIAKLLEVQGEVAFKTRAYQRFAHDLKRIPEPLQEFADAGELRTIPGVGIEIEKKILELLATGKLDFYERLLADFPPQFPEILGVPGIGAKLAARLWKELGVSSLAELETALQSGAVAALPKVGPKTAAKLLEEVEALKQHKQQETAAP